MLELLSIVDYKGVVKVTIIILLCKLIISKQKNENIEAIVRVIEELFATLKMCEILCED